MLQVTQSQIDRNLADPSRLVSQFEAKLHMAIAAGCGKIIHAIIRHCCARIMDTAIRKSVQSMYTKHKLKCITRLEIGIVSRDDEECCLVIKYNNALHIENNISLFSSWFCLIQHALSFKTTNIPILSQDFHFKAMIQSY